MPRELKTVENGKLVQLGQQARNRKNFEVTTQISKELDNRRFGK